MAKQADETLMTTRAEARALDAADPLAGCRALFDLPTDRIYLDGNSLGPLTHAARAAVQTTVDEEWGRGLIGAWNTADWINLAYRVGDAIAPLVGAAAGNIVCCDSTSVNLYKVLAAALALRPTRSSIVAERDNFPTDLYIAEQAAARADTSRRATCRVQWLERGASIVDALDDDVAVLMLTHVDYRSGAMHDMVALTAAAHAAGALVVWDLAHSAGAVPLALDADGVDFAVGCGYKYLNGGPGAPAFIYAHPCWHGQARQPLTGWFGHAAPFAFEPGYRARGDIGAFLTGTPGVLGMRALEAALSAWDNVTLVDVHTKSAALGDLFIAEVEARCAGQGLALASPRDASHRGSQVSFRHPEAYGVMQALIEEGVVGDMRAPDILRFGFAPLYTRYIDVIDAVARLAAILAEGRYREPRFNIRHTVT